jgi:hypothetical protein
MPSPKIKRQPPERDFNKYFATFESDPLKKTVGLKSINPASWHQFGPILSSSSGYINYTEEATTDALPGTNTFIENIGFDFIFDGVTYNSFIASPHGWLALIDPANIPTVNTGTIYHNRFFISGSSSFDNSAVKQAFIHDDLLVAPWFDQLMMTHRDVDTFVNFFSGSNAAIASRKEDFLYGKVDTRRQPYNERNFGMKYAVVDNTTDGKSLVVRWSSMGYKYRGIKLLFEAVLYQNGKIEFGYAPVDSYSTQYTLLDLSSAPANVWKLDESTGATVNDAMNANNLIYKTPANMRPSAGIIDTASFFSGSTSTVIYANDATFANYVVTDSFSFSAWFKGALLDSSTKCILSRMENNFARGYSFTLAGGSIVLTLNHSFNTETLQVTSVPNSYSDDNWHHAVVTYNGNASASGVKIYIDGQQISTTTTYSTLTVSSNIQGFSPAPDFLIGAIGTESTNDQRFTGSIDDVARWNAVITSNDVNTIYENGLAGISVADITPIGNSTTSYATCGIFASGSSTWNYRDFAPLLGVMSASRKISDFGGGLYTGSYFDIDTETSVTASYAVNIGINHWPRDGGRITFSPPQRRRQLNRTDLHADDSKQYYTETGFDDRKLIVYIEQNNVDASTSLPLSAVVSPTYPGVHLKQNLISSGGIRLPIRKVISGPHYSYFGDELENRQKIEPFSESNLPEQGRRTEEFFETGSISYIGNNANGFSRNLSNKKTIRMSFAVDKKIKMFTSGSSLYYYNVNSGQWNIPTSSLTDHASSSLQKLAVTTTALAGGTCEGSLYLEDKIGFDAQGNAIVSGNLNIFRATSGEARNQSTNEIGTLFSINNHSNILTPEYAKSIQRNSSYNASSDEIFILPLDNPFLIEKAVIEIPFCMGDSWFNDKTTFTFVSASNFAHTASNNTKTALTPFSFFDEGGPAITVALFCQRNHGTGSVRDLVFKTTFSHIDDEHSNIGFTILGTSGSNDLVHTVTLLGNESNSNILSDYVAYETINAKKQFTGSVLTKLDASITNCANVGTIKGIQTTNISTSSILTNFDNFLNTEFVSANSITSGLNRLSYLLNFDSFGRSMSGFSAGSGGEYITTEGVLFGSSVKNPFYVSETAERQAITSSLQSQITSFGTGSYIYCLSKIQLGGQKQLPYIAQPGDKFVLAVSKSRPAFKNVDIRLDDNSLTTGKIANVASSSYYNNIANAEGHDVFFNTGSINITFYGSNIQAGREVQ